MEVVALVFDFDPLFSALVGSLSILAAFVGDLGRMSRGVDHLMVGELLALLYLRIEIDQGHFFE